jgi:hypothetical protein
LENQATKEQRDADSVKNNAEGKKAGKRKLTNLNPDLTKRDAGSGMRDAETPGAAGHTCGFGSGS